MAQECQDLSSDGRELHRLVTESPLSLHLGLKPVGLDSGAHTAAVQINKHLGHRASTSGKEALTHLSSATTTIPPPPQHCSLWSCGACAQESLVSPPGSSALFLAAQPLCIERHPGSGGCGCRGSHWVVSVETRPGRHSPASHALLQSCVPRTNSLPGKGDAKRDKGSTSGTQVLTVREDEVA